MKSSVFGSGFPVTVKSGSVGVKIYRVTKPAAASGYVYAVAWTDPARGRLTRQFADLTAARTEAKLTADRLAKGQADQLDLTPADRAELIAARRLVEPSGVPLLAALQEWSRAREITGALLLPAAEAWAVSGKDASERLTVQEAVTRFLAAKERAGVDVTCGLKKTLPTLAESLGAVPIASVSARALSTYLEHFSVAVTRNSHRKRIVTLWRWCRKQGYLPRNAQTEAEQTERARELAPVVGIITPAVLASLIALFEAKHPHYLPALGLSTLAGLRRSEIHGQAWEDIDLSRALLRVTAAKRGTPSRRLVRLCPRLLALLRDHAKTTGGVCANAAIDRIRDIAKAAHHLLPDNCFRHSYISHRVAATGNVPETALEAGNSVSKIHRHYRELVTKEQGLAWFGGSVG